MESELYEMFAIALGLLIAGSAVITALCQKKGYDDRTQLQKAATWVTFVWIALLFLGYMAE